MVRRGRRAVMWAVIGSVAAMLTVATGAVRAQAIPAIGPTPVFRLGPDPLDYSGVPDPTPIKLTGLAGTSIRQIVGNDDHALALTTGGKLFAWGDNYSGELGDGTTVNRPDPVQIAVPSGLGKIVQISSADLGNVALTSKGKVLAWPGLINGVNVLIPTVVSLPYNELASSVSAGDDFVECITRSGQVWGWGSNFSGELGTGATGDPQTPVKAHLPAGFIPHSLATGVDHTLALGTDTTSGRPEVLAWGANDSGELGDGQDGLGVRSLLPVVAAFPSTAAFITSISAWGIASGAIDATGTVYTWGGTDISPNQVVPTALALPLGVRARALSVGVGYSLVTTSANQLLGWGINTYGGLGPDIAVSNAVPTAVPLPAGTIVSVSHSFNATYVVL